MTPSGTSRLAVTAIFWSLAFPLTMRGQAETAASADLETLQADVRKAFKEQVTPFVKNYCVSCHGNRRSKGGVNFESAVKYPGSAGFAKHWKNALTNVKALDMPPDDAEKQPTEAERRIAAQAGREERLGVADVIITNDGPLEDLERAVDALWEQLARQAADLPA